MSPMQTRTVLLEVDLPKRSAIEEAKKRGIDVSFAFEKKGRTTLRADMIDFQDIVSWWMTGELRFTR